MTVKIHLEKFWYHSGFLNTRSYLSTTIFYINWESINLYFEGCMTCTLTNLQVSGWGFIWADSMNFVIQGKKKKKREREKARVWHQHCLSVSIHSTESWPAYWGLPEYGINTACQCQYIVPKVDLHTEGCQSMASTLPVSVNT